MRRRRAPLATTALALTLGLATLGATACSHAGHAGSRTSQDAPVSNAPTSQTDGLTSSDIDDALRAAWRDAGVTPASRVDDAGFLRRAWLDLAGSVPPPDLAAKFLSDAAPDKREKAVATLLASSRFAEHMANQWERLLLGPLVRLQIVDRKAFHDWVKQAFATNTPFDRIAYQLLTATGKNQGEGDGVPVNGAVNWLLRFRGAPEDLAGTASRVFLGVQIQCAQCHDHKTEKWKQADFQSFTACFMRTKARPIDKEVSKTELLVEDTMKPSFLREGKKKLDASPYAAATPRALDGTDFAASDNPRRALASWMTGKDNPWFAKEFVNRMWSELLGRGFVEPVDDLRPSNPAELPAVFDRLAKDFVAHGYDVRRLLMQITGTEAYQLANKGGDAAEAKLWSRYPLKPLGPDELLDSIVAATGAEPVLDRVAGDGVDGLRMALRRQVSFLFDVDEEPDEGSYQGTVAQALMLLNGRLVNGTSSFIPGDALASTLDSAKDDAAAVTSLYLRTLSRPPTKAELDHWVSFIAAPRDVVAWEPPAPPPPNRGEKKGNPAKAAFAGERRLARTERLVPHRETARQQAFEDLFWALLNSSEFTFNH